MIKLKTEFESPIHIYEGPESIVNDIDKIIISRMVDAHVDPDTALKQQYIINQQASHIEEIEKKLNLAILTLEDNDQFTVKQIIVDIFNDYWREEEKDK